jgi:thienamycin biosynthesis protein ThnN
MNRHLQKILALHFDPQHGSAYWLRRAAALGFDVRARVRTVEDLALFGPFDLGALSAYPVSDFIPRALAHEHGLVLAETGGTSGEPRPIAFSNEDFHAAFIEPFLRTVSTEAVFNGGHWLWLGPGGPHIIGRAAQRIAALTTGRDAFSVDFDPRWFRRLAPGSLSRTRYLEHVLEQALRIMRGQDVRYLFGTPVVLRALAPRLSLQMRTRIRFIYLGGMPVAAEAMLTLGEQFAQAAFLAGYGNTLFGVLHERTACGATDATRDYLPQSHRQVVRVIPLEGDTQTRIAQSAAPGARGQVMMHRLDRSGFLPCVLERDSALRLVVSADQDGLGDPQPLVAPNLKIDSGIY